MEIIATNITSPIGRTTEENYQAVRKGCSALRQHKAGERGVPFEFCAALFEEEPLFEELAYTSAAEAISQLNDIDLARTVFILSTTKGEIGVAPGDSATHIASRLGIQNKPVVVCNACISGVAAQILATRLLEAELYDYAVVTGADVLNDFIVSGFQSLKALSPEPCRPFDIERLGLNLGEAAATVVLAAQSHGNNDTLSTIHSALRNDAYHITNPHPKGEGAYLALKAACRGIDTNDIACISVHGTATMYNDQMESMAIQRAGLSGIPATALKGYYGHTLGAAGLLETILTARALQDGIILATKGYEERGVSGQVNIAAEERTTSKRCFVKMMSGFGGCNAAMVINAPRNMTAQGELSTINENKGNTKKEGATRRGTDILCRTVSASVAKLIEGKDINPEHTAVILFNRTSSVVSDKKFMTTICDKDNHYPSPSVFVYTLPNICTGEVAMQYGLHGETSFYILPDRDERLMQDIIDASFCDPDIQCIITGWVDCPEENNCINDIHLIKRPQQ